ncbi:MAG: hypothetical protein V3V56_06835 [bacterium]
MPLFAVIVLFAALAPTAEAPAAEEPRPREVTLSRGGRSYKALLFEIKDSGGIHPIYLIEPKKPDGPRRAMLLFGGGKGRVNHVRERDDGTFRLSLNFLMRIIKEIVDAGIAAVPVGMWSELEDGTADEFRLGERNAKNMAAAVRILAARGYGEIFFAGTSRGTLDAANMALHMKHPAVKGVIFTAVMGEDEDVSALPLEDIRLPVLFVHNRYDDCFVTTYEGSREMYERIKNSPRRRFVTVNAPAVAEGRECGAISAHGFLGVEGKVARAMTDWVKGKKVPAEISE